MKTLGKRFAVGVSLFLFGAAGILNAQTPSPPATASETPKAQSAPGPDFSKSYYHFMLARRFRELAGIWNRMDFAEKSISEYKLALEADPDSLFLKVELAELYWRLRRVGDAVQEAEGVLKVNPDYEDAHRLLAQIYWHNLGENEPEKLAKESLRKAIEHLEALTRVDPSETEAYVSLGRLYKLDNQGAKAEGAFKKVLAKEPASKGALANLARLYFERADYDLAIELLKKIPESDLDAQLLDMLAYAYSQTRNYSDALATYEKALAQDPENADLRRAYAQVLMSGGKIDAARGELQKILRVEPEDGLSYLRLAQLDRQIGRFDDARQELERAKNLLPDNPEVAYQQAILEETVGNEDKAIQILQSLVQQSERPEGRYTVAEASNRVVFLERLGMTYRSQEKYEQAMELFKQIIALGKNHAPRGEGLIIETLRLSRQPQKALEEAEAAVRKYPQDRPLRIVRAMLLAELGHLDQSVPQLEALLNGTPADREVQMNIAQVYSQAKRYAEAEAAIQKALALSPKPEDQEYALFMLGSIYERQKKFDLAEQQFKKVLAVDPLNAAASNYLGYMLADRGVRLEESLMYIKKAVSLEPNNGAYLDSLGWAYFKMNRPDLAEAPLEKAARLVSKDPTIHEHLGHLYLRLGRKTQAQQEWERALKEWPGAVTSDFDSEQAAKLRKTLEELKVRMARERTARP